MVIVHVMVVVVIKAGASAAAQTAKPATGFSPRRVRRRTRQSTVRSISRPDRCPLNAGFPRRTVDASSPWSRQSSSSATSLSSSQAHIFLILIKHLILIIVIRSARQARHGHERRRALFNASSDPTCTTLSMGRRTENTARCRCSSQPSGCRTRSPARGAAVQSNVP